MMMNDNEKKELTLDVKKQVIQYFSDTAISNAKRYIRKYESDTDAIHLKNGIRTIRNMMLEFIEASADEDTIVKELMREELLTSICNVNRIITKLRKKRPMPELSVFDKKQIFQIAKLMEQIVGPSNKSAQNNIAGLLIESSKRYSNKGGT